MAFWKPGTVAPGSEVPVAAVSKSSQQDRENEKETNFVVYNPNSTLSLQQQRVRLPIFANRSHILYLVENFQVVVIVGETGSGKTTQIPQYLYEAGYTANGKLIGITQPRRVAAMSIAARVADEMGVSLGKQVGYSIRFDDTTDLVHTRIKFLTDGMLRREIMMDPLLSRYSVIMLDEAHERSLYTDILLGLLKKICKKRVDLRLIISSATIDAEDVKNYFNNNVTNDPSKDTARILSIEGRTFPVDIHYSIKSVPDYVQGSLLTVMDIHKYQPAGDILVFLTGQEEIDTLVKLIKEKASDAAYRGTMKIRVLPLYAGVPHDRQLSVFQPAPKGTRKIIVATNIAETSVTIDGIVYVVDCGFVKIRLYNPILGLESLEVVPISQATAKQRAGRAGRNRPGKAYRLYTEDDYAKLSPSQVPEMQRTNLATVVLQLKAMGIDNLMHFDFMSPPPVDNMIRALEILYSLGALNDDAKLTEVLGNHMSEFPVDPYMAKTLISSGLEYGCSEEILSLMAVLSVQSIYNFTNDNKYQADAQKRKYAVYEGDHLTLINIYNSFLRANKSQDWCNHHYFNYRSLIRATDIRVQLKKYLKKFKVPIVSCQNEAEKVRRCLVSGYFANAARLMPDGTYKTVRGNQVLNIHPTSVLNNRTPEWVVYHEVIQTNKIYMREVSIIEPQWLAELAPHFYDYLPKSLQKKKELPSSTNEKIVSRSVF